MIVMEENHNKLFRQVHFYKINQMNKLEVGMTVTIKCNVYSREYKGKYYHNIDGYWFSNQTNNPEVNEGFITTDDNDMPF